MTEEPKELEPLAPKRALTLQERIEEHKMAGYGAMACAIAGAVMLGPLGAALGGAVGGGVGGLLDKNFRKKNDD